MSKSRGPQPGRVFRAICNFVAPNPPGRALTSSFFSPTTRWQRCLSNGNHLDLSSQRAFMLESYVYVTSPLLVRVAFQKFSLGGTFDSSLENNHV